jgi:hypothetical protein
MADRQQPKIIIENNSGFGGRAQQITLDTNRVDIAAEGTSRFANAIAFSTRAWWIDLTQWITFPAFAFSLAKVTYLYGWVSPMLIAVCLALPLGFLVIQIAFVVSSRPRLTGPAIARIASIALGAFIGAF